MSKLTNNTAAELVAIIAHAANALGWQVALPDTEDVNAELHGLIAGTPEYLDWLLKGGPNPSDSSDVELEWED